MTTKGSKKVKYWLTSPCNTDYEHLKMRPNERSMADAGNCKSCLWFAEGEDQEAKDFYLGLKQWILRHYPYRERLNWLNEEWANRVDEF